jgi:glycerate kinase
MLSRTLLVASSAFGGRLSAQRVAATVARGLQDGGWATELCPLDADARTGGSADPQAGAAEQAGAALRELLDALGFDARMRSSRALVLCERELHEDTLAGSAAFEIATRARQAGVPAFAVTAQNRLDSFDARILDLQAIVEARGDRSLRAAGRALARLV